MAFTDPAGARQDFGHIWGADDLAYLSRYDGLTAVRVNDLGAYVVGITDQPPAALAPTAALRVLSTHEVVAVGDLSPGDAMTLSAFAERTAERTWRLSMASLLAGMVGGRSLDDLHRLLDGASQGPVPETVTRLLSDAAARGSALSDRGVVRLVECADPATATLIARDTRTAAYCRLLGDRHLAVAAEHDLAFRDALEDLGYALPPPPTEPDHHATSQQVSHIAASSWARRPIVHGQSQRHHSAQRTGPDQGAAAADNHAWLTCTTSTPAAAARWRAARARRHPSSCTTFARGSPAQRLRLPRASPASSTRIRSTITH